MFSNSGVVGQEEDRFGGKAPAQLGVRHAALSERNDVLGVIARLEKPAVQGQGKVFVEEDLQAACTAGGWCAATCAA